MYLEKFICFTESTQEQKSYSIKQILDFYDYINNNEFGQTLINNIFKHNQLKCKVNKNTTSWTLIIPEERFGEASREKHEYNIPIELLEQLQFYHISETDERYYLYLFMIGVYTKYFTKDNIKELEKFKQKIRKANWRYQITDIELVINSQQNRQYTKKNIQTTLNKDKSIIHQNMQYLLRREYQSNPIKDWPKQLRDPINMEHILNNPRLYFLDPSFYLQH